MHGKLSLVGITDVIGMVAVALRREGAQTFGSKQLASDDIENALALTAVERRVVETYCNSHIGSNRRVGIRAVDKVVEISAFVEEGGNEGLLHLLGFGKPFIATVDKSLVAFGECRCEHEGIVPKCVEFDKTSCAAHNRRSTKH